MRGYLLGSLDGEQLEQVEVRLMSDSQFQDDLRKAQDELIDDYAFGILPESERERFEQHFLLTPERASKLRFARAMKEFLGEDTNQDEEAAAHSSWRRTLLRPPAGRKLRMGIVIAASLLIAVVAAVLISRQFRNAQITQDQMARAETERQVVLWSRNPPVGDKDSRLAKLSLTPGVLRESVGARRVTITEETLATQLRLVLMGERFNSYEATLFNDEDAVVFAVGSFIPEENEGERTLILTIPAKSLPDGDYQLKLHGTTADGQTVEAGSYAFQVVHKSASP